MGRSPSTFWLAMHSFQFSTRWGPPPPCCDGGQNFQTAVYMRLPVWLDAGTQHNLLEVPPTRARSHARTYTRTHTHTRTYTRTRTHTHTRPRFRSQRPAFAKKASAVFHCHLHAPASPMLQEEHRQRGPCGPRATHRVNSSIKSGIIIKTIKVRAGPAWRCGP